MSAVWLNRNVRFHGVQPVSFIGFTPRSVEEPRLNGQGADVRSASTGRPTARFAPWLRFIPLCQLHDHTVDVGLRELALFPRARLAFSLTDFDALIRARRGARRAPVVALRLDRLGDLQRVPQPLVLDHRALVDL